jgi:MscS family membrane protein
MKTISLIFFFFLAWTVTVKSGVVTATSVNQQTQQSEVAQVDLKEAGLASPKVALLQFLNAMQRVGSGDASAMSEAMATMDLSRLSGVIRQERGAELARLLYRLLQAHDVNSAANVGAAPTGNEWIVLRLDQGRIVLKENTQFGWQFSAETIAILPSLYESSIAQKGKAMTGENGVALPVAAQVRDAMPAVLKQGFILEYWQWLGLFIMVIVGSIADKALAWFLKINVARWQRTHPSFEALDPEVLRPIGLMAMALMWWSGLNMLGLPNGAFVILLVAVKLLVSLSGIWSAFRLVEIFSTYSTYRAAQTENKFDDLLVPMITKSIKVFVVLIGIIFAADNLNIDVTSLLAGLGLGGLAFALAAKDLLGNFFGSITVLLDRPFSIGDWVRIGDVEGVVEQVGFRSTCVRTFDTSLITMPNSILTTTTINNMGARPYRRMKTMLSLTYDTKPEEIEAFCEGIRHLVERHPHMRKDNYQVYFNQYGAASLEILVYVFWITPDWKTELQERHAFLLDILRLAKQLGVEFAFPTQTLYLRRDEPAVPADKAFQPMMSQQDAMSLGRNEAEAILKQTLDTK